MPTQGQGIANRVLNFVNSPEQDSLELPLEMPTVPSTFRYDREAYFTTRRKDVLDLTPGLVVKPGEAEQLVASLAASGLRIKALEFQDHTKATIIYFDPLEILLSEDDTVNEKFKKIRRILESIRESTLSQPEELLRQFDAVSEPDIDLEIASGDEAVQDLKIDIQSYLTEDADYIASILMHLEDYTHNGRWDIDRILVDNSIEDALETLDQLCPTEDPFICEANALRDRLLSYAQMLSLVTLTPIEVIQRAERIPT